MDCDSFVVVTAKFRILYVFVIMKLGTRRILNQNVTAHPTAEWTLQQLREALPGGHPYRFVIRDRGSIILKALDQGVTDLGVRVLRAPVRAPLANCRLATSLVFAEDNGHRQLQTDSGGRLRQNATLKPVKFIMRMEHQAS